MSDTSAGRTHYDVQHAIDIADAERAVVEWTRYNSPINERPSLALSRAVARLLAVRGRE